jgi:hypothetical protein
MVRGNVDLTYVGEADLQFDEALPKIFA